MNVQARPREGDGEGKAFIGYHQKSMAKKEAVDGSEWVQTPSKSFFLLMKGS